MGPQKTRRIDASIESFLADEPVVAIQGPRTVGKSTLLRALAQRHGAQVFDLDDLATRSAVAADPLTIAAAAAPVLIDEFQHVPQVLDAIKSELNRDLRPGRFVITGSTRHDALPVAAQALTGRLHIVTVLPFSQGEITGDREDFVDRLVDHPLGAIDVAVASGPSTTSRAEYVRRVAVGGFPLAVERSAARRARWFDDYVRLSLERDVLELRRLRQRALLPRLFAALAAQTGQVLNVAAASARAGLESRTGEEYLRLLEAIFLLHRLPAWGTTLRARAASRPKIHIVDSGVAARVLRLTPEKLGGLDATTQTQFGHLLESFAVGEVLKQLSWREQSSLVGHWRTRDGDEVDMVVERDDGTVIAIEVKASRHVAGRDFAPLARLREAVGARFTAGVVLFLGERGFRYKDRLAAIPLDCLWTPGPTT